MTNWTMEEKAFGLLSAAAPLVAFACAASFYANLTAMSEPQWAADPKTLVTGLGLAYFLAMVVAAIFNLSGLVTRFESGEPLPRRQQVIFGALVAFGAANIVVALFS